MKNSSYPHGFSNGVDIKEIPIESPANKANVFWVDSTVGSNGNKGNRAFPFATLAYAITRCTASNGDFIYLAPGHVETVIAAGTVTLDKAGVTVVFLGEGSNRAYINYTTAAAASVIISGASTTLVNPMFVAGIDALTGPISITGANCTIVNGEWYDAAAKAAIDCVVGAATATGLVIDGWKFFASTTGTQKQSNIQLNGVDNAVLKNIDISGDFATGNIENITDELLNVRLENIKLINDNAAPKPGIVLDADCTGLAKNLDVRIASGTTYVSSVAKLNWDNSCLGYNTDGYAGDPIGTAAAIGVEGQVAAIKVVTDALPNAGALTTISTAVSKVDGLSLAAAPVAGSMARFVASGGTSLGTQLADSKSLVDAIGSNGTALAYGSGSALGAIGTTLVIQKTLVSSAIVQAGVDVTGVSSGGALMIEDIFINTNATGLAAGTNFTLETNNASGVAVFFAETVANLGANKTENVASGSVTGITGIVLETGKKIIAKSTVADCTGAGTITLTIKLRRVAAGATIAAA